MDGRKETQKVAGIGKRDMEMQSAAETKPTIVEKRNVTEPESKKDAAVTAASSSSGFMTRAQIINNRAQVKILIL